MPMTHTRTKLSTIDLQTTTAAQLYAIPYARATACAARGVV
jgi:hypothetical protein